ncbi:MAG TPA: hypothetical protein VGZ93_07295 [Candidatus Methylacidiphilales bacterium]|nr:hypothetical protein [Candidatus Methylacidiphilales bacterium]
MISRIGDEAGERGGQSKKDEGLHESDKELIEITGDENDEGKIGSQFVHGVEEILTTIDVSEKAEGEGNGADNENGKDFDPADQKENYNEKQVDDLIGKFGFRSENVEERSAAAGLAEAPVEIHEKENRGVGGGSVDIGIGSTQKRFRNFKIPNVGSVAPADGAEAGKQSESIFSQDKDKKAAEVPESPFHGLPSGKALDEIAQQLNEPFDEILYPGGDELRRAHGHLNDNNNNNGGESFGDHRIIDLEAVN